MKKIVCLLIVLSSGFASAQQNVESDIKVIRDLYQQEQENINRQSKGGATKNQLQVTTQKSWLNRGNQIDTYNFYFHEKPGTLGEDDNVLYGLSFVKVKNSGAARNSDEEYLFNNKGELIFYFIKFKEALNDNEIEIRLYYKNGKTIRNLIKQTEKKNKKVTELDEINVLYAPEVEHPLKASEKIKKLFNSTVNQWMYYPDVDLDNFEHEPPIRSIHGGGGW